LGCCQERSSSRSWGGILSHLIRRRERLGALTLALIALTGCAGAGGADRTPDVEVSQQLVPSTPLDSTTTAASSTVAPPATSGDDGGDAAAAEFTRGLFGELRADEPGCTVAVGRDGEIVFAEAYGAALLGPFEPMTVDTVVDIGSVSKQFTATAILLLAQRGIVDLDAPLSTYLPDLPAWAARPTLSQLIHHQSGIPEYIDLLLDRGFALAEIDALKAGGTAPWRTTEADALAALQDVADLDFAPGARWEYSNSNYFLLSQVVSAVTGHDLGAFLAAEVFEPLGLDMVMDPIAVIEDKAVSYERDDDGVWQVVDSRWEQIGAGGIQTTPSQLVAWAAQYWEPTIGAPTIDAERFDSAANEASGTRYGAGIIEFSAGGKVGRMLTHDGGWGGFVTTFSVAPTHHLAVAVTCTRADWLDRLTGNQLDIELLTAWIGSN
jgi:CubicO group peptidase (beta-lactamase class C family)